MGITKGVEVCVCIEKVARRWRQSARMIDSAMQRNVTTEVECLACICPPSAPYLSRL